MIGAFDFFSIAIINKKGRNNVAIQYKFSKVAKWSLFMMSVEYLFVRNLLNDLDCTLNSMRSVREFRTTSPPRFF